jgi:hypothetical protein
MMCARGRDGPSNVTSPQQHLHASLAVRQISQIADVAARNVTTIVHMTR